MKLRFAVGLVVGVALFAAPARAQIELGVQVASARSGSFDGAEAGVGGRVSWHATKLFGLEAELNVYPGEFPDRRPFSRDRIEGLFGVTAGTNVGRFRPFAKLRPGFVRVHESPGPFACIRIYPPPLACTLADGGTLPALDVGGGVDIATTSRTFLRIDLGDRILRYPGPAMLTDRSRVFREDAFFGHDFRIATGAGLRF